MIKNETILASIYMIKDYKNGVHFLEETVDRVLNELKLLDAELEALQSSSCLSCEYDGTFRYMGKDSKCTRCCNFFSSRYVKKGKKDDNSKI